MKRHQAEMRCFFFVFFYLHHGDGLIEGILTEAQRKINGNKAAAGIEIWVIVLNGFHLISSYRLNKSFM